MADEFSNHGVEDRGRINVNQPHEIRYWPPVWVSARSICARRWLLSVAQPSRSPSTWARL